MKAVGRLQRQHPHLSAASLPDEPHHFLADDLPASLGVSLLQEHSADVRPRTAERQGTGQPTATPRRLTGKLAWRCRMTFSVEASMALDNLKAAGGAQRAHMTR